VLVSESSSWNPQFPETFNWGMIDSPKLSSLADAIVAHIAHEIRQHETCDRILTPGLRTALVIMADIASL
jgi:hypothetical protein